MDIICARCGKHFSSIEAAREHRGNCKETSKGEPIHWVPAQKSKITSEEWRNLMRLVNTKDTSSAALSANTDPAIEDQSESAKQPTEDQLLHAPG